MLLLPPCLFTLTSQFEKLVDLFIKGNYNSCTKQLCGIEFNLHSTQRMIELVTTVLL